jgi:hypothetical protein
MTKNERFGQIFAKTGSINSGTEERLHNQCLFLRVKIRPNHFHRRKLKGKTRKMVIYVVQIVGGLQEIGLTVRHV